jgi:hypothetical protein
MKQVIERKGKKTNQETHILFVDLTKAYDSIPILKFWQFLGELNTREIQMNTLKVQ